MSLRNAAALVMAVLCTTPADADPTAAQQIVAARQAYLDQAPYLVEPSLASEIVEDQLLGAREGSTLTLIEQVEGTGNRADLRQIGAQNAAAILQGYGDGNTARAEQTGDRNLAIIGQQGSGNLVTVLEQSGYDNVATVTQSGLNNLAEIHQHADANRLQLEQRDAYNQAVVNQYGGVDLNIIQTNPGGAAGAENMLSVSAQVEPGYTSNFGPITLNGAGTTALSLCSGSEGFCAPP
jgi:hypothetical protein